MPLDFDPGPDLDAKLTSVEAEVQYVAQPTAPLFSYTYDPPEGRPLSNAVGETVRVRIRDARPIRDRLMLDMEGFAFARHRSAVRDFHDDAEVGVAGHDEVARLVQAATGAGRVVVFDHTFRSRRPGAARGPATRVHNDYTEESGPQRVRDLMGGEAEALLQKRFAFINVWRPVSHPAVDWPLAVCDARSTAQEDFIPTELIYPDRRGEVYAAVHTPAHRWFYFPAMQLDEAVLIKCYDSSPDVARFTLHTGFADPTTPPDAPLRESMEFRAIAFFD